MLFEDEESNFLALAFPLLVMMMLAFVFAMWKLANLLVSMFRRLGPDVIRDYDAEEVPLVPLSDKDENGFSSDPPGRTDGRATHLLSLVVPAYNEEDRLPKMLDETLTFLRDNRQRLHDITASLFLSATSDESHEQQQHSPPSFEIVVVNDGSTDRTNEVTRFYAAKVAAWGTDDVVRLIDMHQNCGKGAAIRAGMLSTDGDFCLMVDADGATDIADLTKLITQIACLLRTTTPPLHHNNTIKTALEPAVAIGSRAHLEDSSKTERSKLRTFLMHAFHFFVYCLCSRKIKDTQCGFKLYTRNAAYILFQNLHLKRWAFDIEIITLAERLKMHILEVAVNWKEVDGSKLDTTKLALALNSVSMLRDMIYVRLCYSLGVWKLRKE